MSTYIQNPKWCAMCGIWTDHQIGKCPQLKPHKEATYRVPVDPPIPLPPSTHPRQAGD